jgi:integrase
VARIDAQRSAASRIDRGEELPVAAEHPCHRGRRRTDREQVYAIADAIEPRNRALVLTATFTSLRLGELRALTCRNLDLLHATVHVAGQLQELKESTLFIAPPKTAAGVRTVSIPQALIPELEEHLARWS